MRSFIETIGSNTRAPQFGTSVSEYRHSIALHRTRHTTGPTVDAATASIAHAATTPIVHDGTAPMVHARTAPMTHAGTAPIVYARPAPMSHAAELRWRVRRAAAGNDFLTGR